MFMFTDTSKYVDEHYFAKNRVNGLPVSENDIILRSFILTQYRRVTDRRTDRQKCCRYYSTQHCCTL